MTTCLEFKSNMFKLVHSQGFFSFRLKEHPTLFLGGLIRCWAIQCSARASVKPDFPTNTSYSSTEANSTGPLYPCPSCGDTGMSPAYFYATALSFQCELGWNPLGGQPAYRNIKQPWLGHLKSTIFTVHSLRMAPSCHHVSPILAIVKRGNPTQDPFGPLVSRDFNEASPCRRWKVLRHKHLLAKRNHNGLSRIPLNTMVVESKPHGSSSLFFPFYSRDDKWSHVSFCDLLPAAD